jgi:hypothetical protein
MLLTPSERRVRPSFTIFNPQHTIERDPRKVVDTRIYNGWVMDRVLPYLEEYACSVEKYPNLSNNDSSHKSLKSYIGGLIDKINRMRVGE